jgi:hypothetical protein
MTETLKYWIEQSEHECDKQLPIGSCFACDMLQLERELTTVTEQRNEAIKQRESSAADWSNQIQNADLRVFRIKRERDEAREQVEKWEQTACDKLSEVCRQIEKTRVVTEQRDRLAKALWSMLNRDDGSAIKAGILLRSLGLQSLTNNKS